MSPFSESTDIKDPIGSVVPKLEGMLESLKGLVNRLLGPNSKLSDSIELGRHL